MRNQARAEVGRTETGHRLWNRSHVHSVVRAQLIPVGQAVEFLVPLIQGFRSVVLDPFDAQNKPAPIAIRMDVYCSIAVFRELISNAPQLRGTPNIRSSCSGVI